MWRARPRRSQLESPRRWRCAMCAGGLGGVILAMRSPHLGRRERIVSIAVRPPNDERPKPGEHELRR
jgi:hypothetical protein